MRTIVAALALLACLSPVAAADEEPNEPNEDPSYPYCDPVVIGPPAPFVHPQINCVWPPPI